MPLAETEDARVLDEGAAVTRGIAKQQPRRAIRITGRNPLAWNSR